MLRIRCVSTSTSYFLKSFLSLSVSSTSTAALSQSHLHRQIRRSLLILGHGLLRHHMSTMASGSTSQPVLVGVVQMNSTQNKQANLDQASTYIRQAVEKGAKMVFLPECFDYIAQDREQTLALSEPIDGLLMEHYRKLAKEKQVWLSLGGFHERQVDDDDSLQLERRSDDLPWLKNSHIIINSEGEVVENYHKVHLFDYSPKTTSPLMESSFTKPGGKIGPIVKSPAGKLGLGICYDLRFPEFSSTLRSMGAQVLLYPSAFTYLTGKAHWHILLRARAVENQCYVIASAQCGQHSANRISYGHSLVVSPWGDVSELDEEPGLLMVQLDLDKLMEIRQQMPVESHRRPDLYFRDERSANEIEKYSIPCSFEGDETVPFGQARIKKNTVFLESAFSRAFVNRKCVLAGHVLVVTRRPAERLHDLNNYEIKDLFIMAQFVQEVMEKKQKARSSTITIQDGLDAGQTMKHVHIHIIPRSPMDFPENDKIYAELERHDKGPDVRWRDEEDMIKECMEIRELIYQNYPQKVHPLGYPFNQ